jgi:hypothetical protein
MSIKTKTIAAAALAALTLPAAAIADGSDRAAEAHKKNSERQAKKSHTHKGKAFTIQGVDFTGVTLNAESELTGPITFDPTSANKHARKALDLTKTELRGEDTVTFGEADDKVILRYVGLQPTDALLPTDKVKVIGKVNRAGELNLRKITVIRETETETKTAEKQS